VAVLPVDAIAAAGAQGLPNVNPGFTWVRLAQRVPVHIAIDQVPPGTPLVSGLSATVTIKEQAVGPKRQSQLDRAIAAVETRLSDVLNGPPARPECVPATTAERADPQSVQVDRAASGVTPEQINPELATGMDASPRNRS
jgi:hypothetical protein